MVVPVGILESSLPKNRRAESGELLDLFLDHCRRRGLELYPAQEEAILELFDGRNVILNTPTGSGKSLVALALHFKSLAWNRRSVYTSPIKALVNEKFLDLCRQFGAEQVGLMTGDASVNRDAPILCCTAEILANFALRDGERSGFDDVVIDEFHYYSDRDRGAAWQVPLLTLSRSQFLLMTATLGNPEFFEKALRDLTRNETVIVQTSERPVPLEFKYEEVPLEQVVENLAQENKAPIYIVHFTQLEAAQNAQNFTSLNFCSREEKQAIAEELQGFRFSSPYGKDLKKYLRHGIGVHHAGLLPKYRLLVEKLAQKGLLKLICGTDTLGVGVNVPIRTVLLTKLCKFDGQKTAILSVRDFHQICGRAGRKGFDDRGWVVAMAPEHHIENLKLQRKAAKDGKKARKIVKRKPPERGYVPWDEKTFERLLQSRPEKLHSSFQVTHGMLLNVLSRGEEGCDAMRRIIRNCHESEASKRMLRKRAWQLFRSMLDREIIGIDAKSHSVNVNVELQEDFSLNQSLSLFLIDTLPSLDAEKPEYPLDLLSLVESILENPTHILNKQLDRVKDERMAEMKAEGLDYDQRMEELETLEYPKPNRDQIYNAFNEFAAKHPWVEQENIRPKSVAREMFEHFFSFDDLIRRYQLNRVEGVLLRYLSEVFKVLEQTVPDPMKTPEVREMALYFELMIRQADSSLLDEWRQMKDPRAFLETQERRTERPVSDSSEARLDPVLNRHAFDILMRNQIFGLVRLLAAQNYEEAAQRVQELSGEETASWTPVDLSEKLKPFFDEHEVLRIDADARNPSNTQVETEEVGVWKARHRLLDPEDHNDWALYFTVDLVKSKMENRPVMTLDEIAAG